MTDTTITLVPPGPGFPEDLCIEARDLLELIKWAQSLLNDGSLAAANAAALILWLEGLIPREPEPNYRGCRITKLVTYDKDKPKALVELEGQISQWTVLFSELDLYTQRWILNEWWGRKRCSPTA